jgi:hypothetical protein
LITGDLRAALTSIDLIGEAITQVAQGQGTADLVDPDLWASAGPKLTAAVLSLVTLSVRQRYELHAAAVGRRAIEAAIDIVALTPQPLLPIAGFKDRSLGIEDIFSTGLQERIDTTWPEALEPALADVPRSATMSAIDRKARELLVAHWPVDLSGAKLSTLVALKLVEETIVRLEVYAAAIRSERAVQQYLFIEDAGAAFYALRSLGRAGMFLAQAARRDGAGVIPDAPDADAFEGAAKTICHALRLVGVKAFDLAKERKAGLEIPDWVEPLRSAKVIASADFNRELVAARSAILFRPKQPPAPPGQASGPAAGIG